MGAKRWESGRNPEESAREYTFGLAPNGWLAFSGEGTRHSVWTERLCSRAPSYEMTGWHSRGGGGELGVVNIFN